MPSGYCIVRSMPVRIHTWRRPRPKPVFANAAIYAARLGNVVATHDRPAPFTLLFITVEIRLIKVFMPAILMVAPMTLVVSFVTALPLVVRALSFYWRLAVCLFTNLSVRICGCFAHHIPKADHELPLQPFAFLFFRPFVHHLVDFLDNGVGRFFRMRPNLLPFWP